MPTRLESFFLRKTSTAYVQLDALDGLRGIAVLLVVLSHLSNADLFLLPGLDFRGTGKYGVYLFFSLSAFLLTRPLLRDDADLVAPRGWIRYALRRALRILPLYWLVLFTNWAVTQWAPTPAMPSLTTDEWIGHLLFQQGKGVYWTIPVEVSYYFVLPFVAATYRALRLELVAISCATGAAIAFALLVWPVPEDVRDSLNVGVYLPIFLLGSYAAAVDTHWNTKRPDSVPRRKHVATALALLGALGIAAISPAGASLIVSQELPKDWMHGHTLPFGLAWAAVVLGTLHGAAWLERGLSLRALRLIGVVSFSVYLWHIPVARSIVLLGLGNPWLVAWAIVVASVAVGIVSFALVEWPFTRSAFVERGIRRIGRSEGDAPDEPRAQ